jgi:enoyl-CoA hydratase
MEDKIVLYEKIENIALITFNRPKALNALNSAVNWELITLLKEAEDDDEIKVVILTGAGDKAFIAGSDIKEMSVIEPMGAREFALRCKRVTDKIWNLKKPVIAAINGFCLGGGLEYAMCCDIRIASQDAKFGQPEVTLGILPGSGGTQRLPRLIGFAKAKELCLTGSLFNADEALKLGLISYVYPRECILEEAVKLAKKISNLSKNSLSLIKSAMNKGFETDLETALLFEIDCFALCFSTPEQKEKMAIFLEKKA